MTDAFDLSEKYNSTVIIRETRSFTQQEEKVAIAKKIHKSKATKYQRETLRFVPVPKNVVEKHKQLHRTLDLLGNWVNGSSYNKIYGVGKKGIIAAGFVFSKLLDVLGNEENHYLTLLKLGTLYPLPKKVVSRL